LVVAVAAAQAAAQEAGNRADRARAAAEDAGKAVQSLANTVEEGFRRIEQRLPPPSSASPSSSSAPDVGANPSQQPTARGKGTSGYKP
jgi:hypothetical protein